MSNIKYLKLRFPEFTGEWEVRKLGELIKVNMCKRIFSNQTASIGEVPFYKIGTLGDKADSYISRELFEEYKDKYNYPRKGEILITCSGTVGKTVIYDGRDSYYQDSNIVWLNNDNKIICNSIIKIIISRIDWNRKLNSTTITRLYNDDIRSLIIEFPTEKEEQQKIGDFFMLLDKRIEQQEQKIALLKDYKKGMMQKIFSQKIRFKDENGNDYPDWEEKKLGEIGVFYRGHSYKATDVSSEGLLVLRSNNISNDSITLSTGLQYVTKKCNNEIILENNDIVICMANGSKNLVGKSGIFHKKNEFQTVTAGAFCSIYRAQNSLSRYLFQTDKYKKYLSILFSGTNINNLKNSDLEELKFKLPKRAEEKRIFLLFQKLDINIEKQEGILENLKNQKEVLLQKMFI
ncbi:MAG: restriction endonuclease subunit S [Leptotrichiaceae bacterium]|nr:restriction endonuclease subunit S [Leptotrichiaceae bacterium]